MKSEESCTARSKPGESLLRTGSTGEAHNGPICKDMFVARPSLYNTPLLVNPSFCSVRRLVMCRSLGVILPASDEQRARFRNREQHSYSSEASFRGRAAGGVLGKHETQDASARRDL